MGRNQAFLLGCVMLAVGAVGCGSVGVVIQPWSGLRPGSSLVVVQDYDPLGLVAKLENRLSANGYAVIPDTLQEAEVQTAAEAAVEPMVLTEGPDADEAYRRRVHAALPRVKELGGDYALFITYSNKPHRDAWLSHFVATVVDVSTQRTISTASLQQSGSADAVLVDYAGKLGKGA